MQKLMVDFSTPVFKFPYEIDGIKYYATFHPEAFKKENGLQFSGRYLIVALTPEGQFHFRVEKGAAGNWISADAPLKVDSDLLQWCGERIDARNRKAIDGFVPTIL